MNTKERGRVKKQIREGESEKEFDVKEMDEKRRGLGMINRKIWRQKEGEDDKKRQVG